MFLRKANHHIPINFINFIAEHTKHFEIIRQFVRRLAESDFLNGRISAIEPIACFGFVWQ